MCFLFWGYVFDSYAIFPPKRLWAVYNKINYKKQERKGSSKTVYNKTTPLIIIP